jgi:hypothetical protein
MVLIETEARYSLWAGDWTTKRMQGYCKEIWSTALSVFALKKDNTPRTEARYITRWTWLHQDTVWWFEGARPGCHIDSSSIQLTPKRCFLERALATLSHALYSSALVQSWYSKKEGDPCRPKYTLWSRCQETVHRDINDRIKSGRYYPQSIIGIDETHFDVDRASGETLAGWG